MTKESHEVRNEDLGTISSSIAHKKKLNNC